MSQYDKISRASIAQPVFPAGGAQDDWLDVEALFRIVRRQIGLVLFVGTIVVLAALPSILDMARSYTSTTRILVREPLTTELSSVSLAADQKLNLATESERLLARDISVAVIRDLGLDAVPEFNPALREVMPLQSLKEGLREFLGGGGGREEPAAAVNPMDRIVPEYLGRLQIWRAIGSDVINIGFSSENPELAAQVPNRLIQIYLEARAAQVADRFDGAEQWLGDRIDDQARRVARAGAALEVAKSSPDVFLADTPAIAQAAVTAAAQSEADIQRERVDLNLKIAALRAARTLEEKVEIADSEVTRRLAIELSDARSSLARLRERYGSAHAQVISAQGGVQDLKGVIDREMARAERGLASDLTALERKARRFGEELAAARARFADLRGFEERLAQLREEAKTERNELDQLTQQHRALMVAAQLPATEVEVLSPASVPLAPDGHGRVYYLVLAAVAATVLALTCAFLRELLDKTVRSHEQLREVTSLVPVGSLPTVPQRMLRRITGPGDPGAGSDVYSNSVQGVLLALEQRSNGSLPDSILVTSSLPHEDATTFTVALAKEIASSGRLAMVVDADLHRGTIGRQFGLSHAPGLGDYLSGAAELADIIHRRAPGGFSIVPRGAEGKLRPVDRKKIKDLIAAAAAQNEVVIFDGPPALVSNEALLLAGLVSQTLLVIGWGRTERRIVETVAERLAQPAGGEIDAVITGVNLRRQALYGYRDAGFGARALWKYYRAPIR